MKPIKITPRNDTAIEAALKAVNGKAEAHTYTRYSEIEAIAGRTEKQLTRLFGREKDKPGAVVISRSGDKLPNAYKNTRIVTRVGLERRSQAWFLVDIATETAYRETGKETLHLTGLQDARAVEVLRQHYVVEE